MYANPIAYGFSSFFVLLAHIAMLFNVYVNGNYKNVRDVIVLGATVIIIDIAYFAIILFFKQTTYALDFLLILILNMSFIFQSCFGEVGFNFKHLITCIACIASCKAGFILCRNHKLLQSKKRFIYGATVAVLFVTLVVSLVKKDMWIYIGKFTLQQSFGELRILD